VVLSVTVAPWAVGYSDGSSSSIGAIQRGGWTSVGCPAAGDVALRPEREARLDGAEEQS
jgi:hypothetical protein